MLGWQADGWHPAKIAFFYLSPLSHATAEQFQRNSENSKQELISVDSKQFLPFSPHYPFPAVLKSCLYLHFVVSSEELIGSSQKYFPVSTGHFKSEFLGCFSTFYN